MNIHRTWVEISLCALERNYRTLRNLIGNSMYLAVVKANAYGHGDSVIAGELQRLGADWFGVATAEEGVALRKSGITKPVLIFGYTSPALAGKLCEYGLTQNLYSSQYAALLAQAAKEAGVTVDCHLKLDTGMGRLGFDSRAPHLDTEIAALIGGGLRISGTFTHLAVADELSDRSRSFTLMQLERFENACSKLRSSGIDTGIRHAANSAGTIAYPNAAFDMVRVGISQYGFAPSDELSGQLKLEPLMTFFATVAMVKEIEAGDTLSYGRIYTAPCKRRIATVTVGYADGYPRKLGGLSDVIIRGKRAPVVGRVCMDQLMADVTDIPDAAMGDHAVLAGREGGCEVTFEELAALTDTVHYERICAISPRVERIYLRD